MLAIFICIVLGTKEKAAPRERLTKENAAKMPKCTRREFYRTLFGRLRPICRLEKSGKEADKENDAEAVSNSAMLNSQIQALFTASLKGDPSIKNEPDLVRLP